MTGYDRAPATLSDVAREANVSLATASRVLNSTRPVNEEHRERVLAAAAKLAYTPNLSAQAVARRTSNSVALVVSDITDASFASIAAGVIRASAAQNLLVTMAMTERSSEREIELVRLLRGQRPKALILAGSRTVDDPLADLLLAELNALHRTGSHVVMISQDVLPFDTVLIDNFGGASTLAQTMLHIGYKRFGILAGPSHLVTARDRVRAFCGELAAARVPVSSEDIIESAFSRDGGYQAMTTLLARGLRDLDLIFVVSDVMALGALAALRDHGLEVPTDIALAGYDDIESVRDITPALTTVHVPLQRAGEMAIEMALRDPGEHPLVQLLHVDVVTRASTPAR